MSLIKRSWRRLAEFVLPVPRGGETGRIWSVRPPTLVGLFVVAIALGTAIGYEVGLIGGPGWSFVMPWSGQI